MTDNNEDLVSSAVDPLILEIYLYNNNYKDRLLISELKEKAQTVRIEGIDDSSFFVKCDDMWDILNTKFKKDLNDFESTPPDTLNQSVTSIYFINMIMLAFSNIKYFRISVSDAQIYTRKVNDTIKFDFKIIHSRVNLPLICGSDFLIECRRIFKKIGLYHSDPFNQVPFFETSAFNLFNSLRDYEDMVKAEDPESEDLDFLESINLLFGPKLEKDNSIILVIVDE
jgi:hypothetical protein